MMRFLRVLPFYVLVPQAKNIISIRLVVEESGFERSFDPVFNLTALFRRDPSENDVLQSCFASLLIFCDISYR
jgi:hypothetical protein